MLFLPSPDLSSKNLQFKDNGYRINVYRCFWVMRMQVWFRVGAIRGGLPGSAQLWKINIAFLRGKVESIISLLRYLRRWVTLIHAGTSLVFLVV